MKLFLFIITCLFTANANAWEGFDFEGQSIEIDSAQILEEGNTIDVYYYDTQTYRQVTIEMVDDLRNPSEIEAYDENSNEHFFYNIEY